MSVGFGALERSPKKGMPETTTHQRLRSRLEYLDQHLETVDAGLTALQNAAKSTIPKTLTLAQMLGEEEKYSTLGKPVTDANRMISYSRSTNVEHALVFLSRIFAEYLRGVLREIYPKKPFQVVGLASAGKSISFPELVKLGSYEAITDKIIDDVFRKLENEQSTEKLLNKFIGQFDLAVDSSIVNEGLKYLEMRHLIIHNDSAADSKFVSDYGEEFQIEVGDKLPRRFEIADKAKSAIRSLADAIDEALFVKKIVESR